MGALFIFNGTSDSYQPNLSVTELESRQSSVQLGASLIVSSYAIQSPFVETLSNIYDCATGYCDPNLMLPGSASTYNDSLTFYRGNKANNTQALKSHAAQEGDYAYSQSLIDLGDVDDLMTSHAKNSTNPPSPFVSVTTDPRVADYFAKDDGYIFELEISKDRVTRNPYNDYVIPGGIPESEWLVPNYIKPSEIKKITRKLDME